MALAAARSTADLEVTALLCTVNADAERVAMHAVRRSLLEAQADRLGLPLVTVDIPAPARTSATRRSWQGRSRSRAAAGVTCVVFGDLFLRDVREYREAQLAGTGIRPLFPLWDRPTDGLAREMLDSGLQAIVTCVDLARLPRRFRREALRREAVQRAPHRGRSLR